MRKLLLVGVLGLLGSTGCGAISDWRLESRVRSDCERAARGGVADPMQNARRAHEPFEKLVQECYESNLNQIRN